MEENKNEKSEEKDFNKENNIEIKEKKEIAKELPKPKKKKISKKVKLVIAIIIITVAIVVAVYSLTPKQPYITVGNITSNYSYYEGKDIEVKGTVKDNSTNNSNYLFTFNLTDGKNVLKVGYNKTIPQGFVVGKDVVVSGKLVKRNGDWIFEATDIQVGCPSKYE